MGVAQAGYGIYQQADAKNSLENMGDRPEFNITPEQQQSYNRSQLMAQRGYTAPERAAFQQQLSRSQNTAFQKGIDMGGGGLAGAIRAALSYSNINAQNRFAADDARLHRDNIRYADQRGDQISAQRNRMTMGDQQTFDQLAQAYGAEGKAGVQNMFSGANTAAAGFSQYGQMGGNGTASSPYVDQMAGGRMANPQVTGVQDSYVPNQLQPMNNPQIDDPNMFSFAQDYSSRRYKNPPYESAY